MRLIIYYLSLLVFLAIVTGFLLSQNQAEATMAMSTMIGVSAALVLYVVAMSLVGEGPKEDEREVLHRQIANRNAMIAGTAILSVGILYQLFVTHVIDYWLLAALMGVNLSKIISLIYLNYRK